MVATFHSVIGEPWIGMDPVRLGTVPSGLGTADRFVTIVDSDGDPVVRIDLYRSSEEVYAFEEALHWSRFVVIGWGHRVYLVEPRSKHSDSVDLGCYFGHACAASEYLLIASAKRLFRIEPDASVGWRSEVLGLDGVVVERVSDGVIEGKGEWDPPGGWKRFRLSVSSGNREW